MSEKETIVNTSILKRWVALAVIVVIVGGGWAWWHNVYMSSANVFWGMISNNLSTSSVTRHVTQSASDRSIDQYIREQFGALNATESLVTLKQTDSSGTSIIKSDSIGTTQNDYNRYVGITTPSKTVKGKTINTSGVIGIWGKSDDAKKGQPPNAQYFQQSVLTIVPYGYFTQAQRQSLINLMHDNNVYDFSNASIKSDKLNGRAVYVYKIKVNPAPYVELMQAYVKQLGLGDIGLDPSKYAGSSALNVELTVDKLSRQLVMINYPVTKQSEMITDQNLEQPIKVPATTIPIAELQNRIQKIVQ